MYAFLTATDNLLFSGALALVLMTGAIEILSLMTSFGIFDGLDGLLPEVELGDGDAGPAPGVANPSVADAILSWFNVGKVPFIVTFLVFLFLFGALGLNVQSVIYNTFGGYARYWLAGPIVLVAVLLPLKWANALLGKILPKDETMAVSSDTFVGRSATITIGEATHTLAAEAKLADQFQHTHYIMVLADNQEDRFPQGSKVLVVGRKGANFSVIAIDNPNLKG